MTQLLCPARFFTLLWQVASRLSKHAPEKVIMLTLPVQPEMHLQGVIGPGGVQWMTAGRGIVHSEMPKITEGDLWGFQLWVNLPARDKMVKPR